MTLNKEQLNQINDILETISVISNRIATAKYHHLSPNTDMWSSMEVLLAKQLLRISRIFAHNVNDSIRETIDSSISDIKMNVNRIEWMMQGADQALNIDWSKFENRK